MKDTLDLIGRSGWPALAMLIVFVIGCDEDPNQQRTAMQEAQYRGKALMLVDQMGNSYAAFYRSENYWEIRQIVNLKTANVPTNLVVQVEDSLKKTNP